MDTSGQDEAAAIAVDEAPAVVVDKAPSIGVDEMPDSFIIAEYNALRTEILHHSETQTQLTALSVIALGALLGAGVGAGFQTANAAVVLVYPLVATALALLFGVEDAAINFIGSYIRDMIETKPAVNKSLNWEHVVSKSRGYKRSFRLSITLFFLISELGAIIVGLSIAKPNDLPIFSMIASGPFTLNVWTPDDVLLVLDVIGMVGTLFFLWLLKGRTRAERAAAG